MIGLFGVLGLVISAVGLYGIMAYAVSQRTREIGVRMALGATRAGVMAMVITTACRLCAGSSAQAPVSERNGKGVRLRAASERSAVVGLMLLSLAALVATIVPARRAATIDPIVALRAE